MKTFPVLILFCVASYQEIFSQVHDDFSDGDFLFGPTWRGSTDHFIVNDSRELQLNAAAAGKSWLISDFSATASQAVEWQFFIRQDFAPSGSNFGRFYLASDQADLSGPLNGFYVQFGEAGAEDAVELFRQAGSTSTTVCQARPGAIATAFAVRVKVQRLPDGVWHLSVDYSGGTDYVAESTGRESSELSGQHFGIMCNYTVSNIGGFYFDDIQIDAVDPPDTTPPSVDAVEVVDFRTLKLVFSESLDPASVSAGDFVVLPDSEAIGLTLGDEDRTVTLSFGHSFPNGVESTLRVHDVKDLRGNTLVSADAPFLFFDEQPVAYRDIVISEIFADPSPPVNLPEAEFLELHNRSANPVDLSAWMLSDETSPVSMPPYLLLPKQYVILTSIRSAESFIRYGAVLGLAGFPSLNNAGDRIALRDDLGQAIDSVHYSRGWYRDDEKADGGWSLERIDVGDICSEGDNWIASDAVDGGTPGSQNAANASRPDNTGPRMVSIVAVDSLTLLISFDEKLDGAVPASDQFVLEDGPEVTSVRFADPMLMNLALTLSAPLQRGRSYTLLAGNVYDCPGNRILPDHARGTLLLPEKAATGDVVINEVLFNPRPTGVDFIEAYNVSTKVVDLQGWVLRNQGAVSTISFQGKDETRLLYPGEYVVFVENGNVLKGEYVMARQETFVEINLPPLNDDEGFVTLLDKNGLVIDSIHYSDTMHSGFLKDDEGVSLERISGTAGSSELTNWRSASSIPGFATPGYLNSNAREGVATSVGTVVVEPEVLRPQIAQHDFARIRYHFARGGLIANVRIYDQQGRTIRILAENELLGTEGFFRWDGDTENRILASTGYYMVLFEVFDLDGSQKMFRRRIAVF